MRALGRNVRMRRISAWADRRWNVMTLSPTTAGAVDCTSSSTVSRTRFWTRIKSATATSCSRSTFPASELSAPVGMRTVTGDMCSNESGIDSSRTFIRPHSHSRYPRPSSLATGPPHLRLQGLADNQSQEGGCARLDSGLCLAGDGNRSKELGLYNFLGYDITHAWPTSARDRRATNATS